MKTSQLITTVLVLLVSTTSAFAYSMRTVYEDAADSAPEWFWFATLAVALAYPLLLLILRSRFRGQQTPPRPSFSVFCARVAAKQLLPLVFMVYVVGTFILLGVAIVFTLVSHIVPALQSFETLSGVLWATLGIWYFFSLVVSIKWLPKTPDEY